MTPVYDIVKDANGFHVDHTDEHGTHHLVMGFETEDDAAAWIAADKKLAVYRKVHDLDEG